VSYKILNDILTGRDNKTHDIARWSWVLSFFAIVLGAGYELIQGQTLSLRDFAESIGIISGAHGGAMLMKKDTEPKEQSDVENPSQ
jgi:hypothetical protein